MASIILSGIDGGWINVDSGMIGGPISHLIRGVTGQVQTIFGFPKVKTEGSRIERVYFQSAAYGKFNYLWTGRALWQHYCWGQ